MAYLTLNELKTYLGITQDDDDSMLQDAIDDAVSYIERETHRVFEAATLTKYYGRSALDPCDSHLLHLDDDLLTITTLTNGDASSTAITSADYTLLPRNSTPYHQILLKTNGSSYWQFDTDYWVSVAGTWGYSTTPPGDIKRAVTVLAAYYYHQKDSQVFDTTAIPEAGVITIPAGIPATVTKIIGKYTEYL